MKLVDKSIKIEQYSLQKKKLWDEFIDKSKNGLFLFKRDFMDYHSDRFKDNSLIFYRNNEIIALLPMSIEDNKLYSHGGLTWGGFITDKNMKQNKMLECFKSLLKYLEENNIKKLQYKKIPSIYSKQASEEDLYALFKIGAIMLKEEPSCVVDLKNPIAMKKGRKAQISRALREGVSVEICNDFETFIELENYVLNKFHDSKAVHNAYELKLLKSRFEDNIQLWIAKYKEKMIAAVLLFIYGDVVHTQYMAADLTARKIGGLDIIIKTIIDYFSKNKKFLDFGISTENNGMLLNNGLISQKEGFGGRTVCYETWEINYPYVYL